MTWTADLSTGELRKDGILAGSFYSGAGEGKNNPEMERVKDVGPIPRGAWVIGRPFDSPHSGPYALPLTPRAGTETFGRTGFEIHGDSVEHPGEASHGCIITFRMTRVRIADSGDTRLEVIASPQPVPDLDSEIGV